MASLFDLDSDDIHAHVEALLEKALLENGAPQAPPRVYLGFAWEPSKHAPVVIETVLVNGRHLVGWQGVWDGDSPHVFELGRFASSSKVEVEWSVRSRYDIAGIRAFIGTEGLSQWKGLPPKAPFPTGSVYTGKTSYTVSTAAALPAAPPHPPVVAAASFLHPPSVSHSDD